MRPNLKACRTVRQLLYPALLFLPFASLNSLAQSTPPVVTGDAKVDSLLVRMTLDEKIQMIHGAVEDPSTSQGEAGYIPGIPRLGIPPLRFADGPPGVLTRVPAAAPTSTMGVAATFSIQDARENGTLIGNEAKSHGVDVVLQPFINMDRDIGWERGYNTFGEDPFLTGQIGVAEVQGIQNQHIMAQAKHYIAYDTSSGNVVVDPQALHEIYVAPFADVVLGGVSSLMCSYNMVNGTYSCGNRRTLTTILRKELGFRGFVTSDWGANHATNFINAGLDLEMPGPTAGGTPFTFFVKGPPPPAPKPPAKGEEPVPSWLPEEPPRAPWQPEKGEVPRTTLKSELHLGLVSEAAITRAAGRLLYEMDRFGLLSGGSKHSITPPTSADIESNARIIRKTSNDAAVLLKNEGRILPLTETDLSSLALIGPGAGQVIAVGQAGEKAVGLPGRQVGPLRALQIETKADSHVHIRYAVADDLTGTPVPTRFLSYRSVRGLERFSASGHPIQRDSQVNFTHSNGKPLPANSTLQWKGTLDVPATGEYRLHLQVLGALASLLIDGKRVTGNYRMWVHGDVTQAGESDIAPTTDGLDNLRVAIHLKSGPHAISIFMEPDLSNSPAEIRLNWVTPEQQKENYAAAIEAARRSKVAIVFVWSRGTPLFGLPGDQDKLVRDIAAVNPNTVVVLNVCQPVAMPWLDQVRGVLQMWWPGDEGGWSTADVLLGRVDPAGRLPFTWPRRLQDEPVYAPGHPERMGKGEGGTTIYSEGIFIGYRWFDKNNIQPLFPFGFGLSYTSFQYSALDVQHASDGGLDVYFKLTNTGLVAGDEVPQVYLGAPSPLPRGAQFAVRALAAFDRIHLSAGQTKSLHMHIRPRSLEYWSAAADHWVRPKGTRTISVGSSSRDLLLSKTITLGSSGTL